MLVSKEYYTIYIEGYQMYYLVINGSFIDSSRELWDTILGEIYLN